MPYGLGIFQNLVFSIPASWRLLLVPCKLSNHLDLYLVQFIYHLDT